MAYKTQYIDGLITDRTLIFDLQGSGSPCSTSFSSASNSTLWEIYFDKDVNNLPQPLQPTLAASSTGGTIPRNIKVYVRITAVDSLGKEAIASSGLKFLSTGSTTDTNKITVTITAVAGASSYNVWVASRGFFEILVGNTTSTTYVITVMPDVNLETRDALDYCQPDFAIFSKQSGIINWNIPAGYIAWINSFKLYVSGGIGDTIASIMYY